MNTFCKKLLSSSLLFWLYYVASAQDAIRSKYVETFLEHSMVYPLVQGLKDRFFIKNQSGTERSSFYPNNTYQLGCGINFFGVGLILAYPLQPGNSKIEKFGKTTYRDIRLNLLYGNWGINFFTKKYHGFYREDNFGVSEGKITHRPDIVTTNIGMEGIYALNQNKFSLCSSYIFSERQIRSRGSVILSGTVNRFTLTADSAVISDDFKSVIHEKSSFNFFRYTTMSIAPGYSHTIVRKRFFTNITLAVGPAYYWVKFVTEGQTHYDISLSTYIDFRFAVGYNGQRFFGGINLSRIQRDIQLEKIIFSNASLMVRFSAGMRIKDKGFMRMRVMSMIKNTFSRGKKKEMVLNYRGNQGLLNNSRGREL